MKVRSAAPATMRRSACASGSGLFNTLRQLGGVLGVAATAAVFVRTGGYASAREFSNGFAAALVTTALLSLVGAVVGLRLRGRVVVQPAAVNVEGAKA